MGKIGRVVCFGEVLARLSPPDHELLLQTPRLNVSFGGAETNVAVGLACLGDAAAMVSVLPDNPVGHAALRELRRWGVETDGLRVGPGRMGLYFLQPGAVLRPSEVVYDRQASAFADVDPDLIDWEKDLAGAAWLHLSGITPATGPNATEAAYRAIETADALGVPISFDGNFRSKVWGERLAQAPDILRRIASAADLAFVNDRDIALMLGVSFDQSDGDLREQAAARTAFDAFPRLKRIASTRRVVLAADHHQLSAVLHTRAERCVAGPHDLPGIVDRIGGGDAFCAGLLHGLLHDMPDAAALDYGLACASLKHGIWGDFPLITTADVEAFTAELQDVRR